MARLARRITIFVLGISVVLIGVVMIVAPGPAFVFIPLGLGILATEFFWARRILRWLQARIDAQMQAVRNRNGAPGPDPSGPQSTSRDQDKAA